MPEFPAKTSPLGPAESPRNFLKDIDMFFQKRDPVHQTMRRITKQLEKAKIPYAVVGGMAVFAHGYRRTTDDLDLLLTREGFAAFRGLFVPKDYEAVSGRPKRFTDPANGVTFDILVTGLFPGAGKPGPIAYPDPAAVSEIIEKIRVVDLPTLIQLKLAARRFQDFADVVSLIRVHNLDETFQSKLHPAVHRDYIECLEEKRREDEYEARQDQAFEDAVGEDDDEEEQSSGD
jgi:hypothetical protein